MPNAWFDHVKAYAKEHNMAYRFALKEAGATYTKLPAKPKGTGKRGSFSAQCPQESATETGYFRYRVIRRQWAGKVPKGTSKKAVKAATAPAAGAAGKKAAAKKTKK
eukprot:gene6003-30740_t